MRCPGCHAENAPEARFCNQCGARVTVAVAAEQRQITVLFADLVGSTELAVRLGAEDWRETVRRFQHAAGECVARFEGTVAQYLGDGVLVYFGHPVAHEDDPERALRAGLALLERVRALNEELARELGVSLHARLAAHTGSVVIGEMGGPARRENLALGETPNVAARLQECAPRDALVTSATTLALVSGRFEIEDLGERALKGVSDPASVYRVVREAPLARRSRFAPGRALSPLAGRVHEVAALRAAFDAASAGRGALACITGEPGIGKSRLVHELRRELGGTSHYWLDLHASAYAQLSAFEPLKALLAEPLDGDVPAERERLETLLGTKAAGADDPRLLGPEGRRAATIAALADWLLALAALRPVVLAVEDLHGFDPSTVEALERVPERGGDARLLVVATARSGTKLPDAWSRIGALLELAPLAREELGELIVGAAGYDTLSPEVRAELIERSDGNPLFAEELLRSVASGATTAVPAALRDPLRARLDRTGAAQATAQLASALGREFSHALLRAVSKLDDAALRADLDALVAAALIFERSSPTGPIYQFSHALLRDAAYDSLLRRTRQALHADVARVLQDGFGGLARARPDLLAHHCAAAGDHARAAVGWLRAAKRSTDACAYREALSQVDRALESLAQLPEGAQIGTEVALQIYRGNAQRMLRGDGDPEALGAYQRARSLAERIDDPAGACLALLGVHGVVLQSGTTQDAAELCAELLERAQRSGQAMLIKNAHLAAGLTEYARGDFPGAHEHMARAVGGFGGIAESYLLRTTWMCGEPARALTLCEELAESVRTQSASVQAEALTGIGITYLLARDGERALVYAREAAGIGRREGLAEYLARATTLEGAALVELGDAGDGLARIEAGETLIARQTANWWTPFWASARLAVGDAKGAIALAEEGLAVERRLGRHVCEAELLRVKGEAQSQLHDGGAAAEVTLLASVRAARERGARGWELRAALSASRFLQARARHAEARALLEPTYAAFSEGLDQPDLAAARQLLRQLESGA